ncbi:CoB--CoM heterodisulfide reductase iron-sulfur subunit A family protein [Paludibacter sp.]|uniref:CoB--CoM heterodisulfide reductase iron-sulfur subunit A family protein n=1 Tax=Paludibacter sp. TaxID=1898105 RepID=UPI0013544C2B|nr:CoB--CoM heterodisulfide reductase iron-sulfur subunit A family protein [Paludibacter sp.]MTK53048.1 CoB--CoM heterodisulfide reductase iron-sulfur subunit A family protein [Paludibacter sp.]
MEIQQETCINESLYDVLVIGAGIAGEESALKLADMGYRVLLVEKEPSIGGKMILLSKVFPTLDCAACITTPKVSETARHPNITILTLTEVEEIVRDTKNRFSVTLKKKPRYVVEKDCTGCQECEKACPAIVNDQFQFNLTARKAVYIPFTIANPRVALIDIDNCLLCGACEKACPSNCIDFTQKEEQLKITAKSVIVSTGFKLFDPIQIERYGFGRYKNVITSMQMERQLAPTRPFNNILRPSDGKVPDKIAYVFCAGSRDHTVGNPICSQVCCMYSTKQAQLLMGALPMADVSLYYINIRAFGKGFDEFYEQAKDMGAKYVKGKIASITEKENGNLILRYEDIATGKVTEKEHDLVVLSVGILANPGITRVFKKERLETDALNYIRQTDLLQSPAITSIEGVFAAGTATAPMDIPDTIMSAGAAATETSSYLARLS